MNFPVIDERPAALSQQQPAAALATINNLALSHFDGMESDLRALAERYRAVAFDVSTPKGLDAAKKARQDLRENGRFAVQRAEKQIKDCANDLKRVIAPKVDALIAIVQPVEDHVDGQIKAREEQIAAEKAERERKDAERRKVHTDRIALLSSYIEKAAGKSAEDIAKGIAFIERISTHPDAFEEFSEEATQTKTRVLVALRAMHAKQVNAERQQAENERLRAELEAARRVEAQRTEYSEGRDAQQVLKAEAATPDATDRAAPAVASPRVGAMGAGQPADAGPAVEQVNPNAHEAGQSEGTPSAYASSEPQAAQGSPSGCEDKGAPAEERAPESDHDKPTLTIGKLCSRLSSPHSGLLVTSDFLKALGFEGTKVKSATLFSESQWRGIKAALLTHIQECR